MPVELFSTTCEEAPPSPPSAWFWLILFVGFMLTGAATALLAWPKTEPTSSPWFWCCLLLFPALAWCVVFGLRLNHYDQESDRRDAVQSVSEQDRAAAIEFASEPLAVLDCAYRCAMGDAGVSGEIVEGASALRSRAPAEGQDAIRCTALTLAEDKDRPGRLRPCFMDLLARVKTTLLALPNTTPFDVRLQLPPGSPSEQLSALWRSCWTESGLPPAPMTWLSAEQGLMALDHWLDVYGGPELQKVTLFVAVQLHDTPAVGSAEAAVALLLCWPLVAQRHGLDVLAMMHRPVRATIATLNADIPTVALWGRTTPEELGHVWQSGWHPDDKVALEQAASDIGLAVGGDGDAGGIHNVDTAIGHPGVAAGWLAAALAIEHARQTRALQMIACKEGTLCLAIVRPIGNTNETETT